MVDSENNVMDDGRGIPLRATSSSWLHDDRHPDAVIVKPYVSAECRGRFLDVIVALCIEDNFADGVRAPGRRGCRQRDHH